MDEFKVLKDKYAFHWYKAELDLRRQCEHKHEYEPEKYPCRIKSEFTESDNSRDGYSHRFSYQEKTSCSKCGTEQIHWSDFDD